MRIVFVTCLAAALLCSCNRTNKVDPPAETEKADALSVTHWTERTELFMEALNVDEMVGQVLASEGFAQVEEVAYVDLDEIASIEGFDEGTAQEIQTRAREYLDRIEAELDAKRRELGVSDDLRKIDGMTTAMSWMTGG